MKRVILIALLTTACTTTRELPDNCGSDACIYQTMVDVFPTLTDAEKREACNGDMDYANFDESPECRAFNARK